MKQYKHRFEVKWFVYNDEEMTDCCCWSFFSHLIIDGDDDVCFDDVDAAFICRIHGMILLICTEPDDHKKANPNSFTRMCTNKSILPINPTKKISSIILISSSASNGNLIKIRPIRSLSLQYYSSIDERIRS